MDELNKCGANYVALTPTTFLKRASMVYANRASIIYANVRFNWHQTYQRCCRLASSLGSLNITKNDVVSLFLNQPLCNICVWLYNNILLASELIVCIFVLNIGFGISTKHSSNVRDALCSAYGWSCAQCY